MTAPAVAEKSSKLAGLRRFLKIHRNRSRFSSAKSGAAFGAAAALVAVATGTGWEFTAELGAVGCDVSGVVCTGGVALDDGFSLFLPQPAANIAAPKTSTRHKAFWCVDWCQVNRAGSENVFISKWFELVYERG